ncbi:hypothetical protein [Actinoplanes sp. NPDC020271]|uniref:hypothetical protein n=1 Tax=Actinoplanes sp. NPDC020271 TaxID=3363896 RepID=UPI0037B5B4E2
MRAQFAPGPKVTAHPQPDPDDGVAGIRLMVAEPAVRAEILRAGADAERPFPGQPPWTSPAVFAIRRPADCGFPVTG